ncbi:DSBA oxidoreductase [Enterobacterales bacterium]|nr:DSBA oxidoreductase [Enterobacterales bacterium]
MKILMLMLMMVISPVLQAQESTQTPEQILFNDPATPRLGAKDARLTLVSFTDYNCPYCKQFDPLLERLVKENPDVAVVIKLLPFRGASSISAGRAALTVWQQQPDKFMALHQRMMAKKGPQDEESIDAAIAKVGLAPVKVTPESYLQLKTNVEIAEVLGIQGTPATIIGDQLVAGAISWDDLNKIVNAQLEKVKNGKG